MNSHPTILASIIMLILASACEAQVPRWTSYRRLTEDAVPEAAWAEWYGFTVVANSNVVENRFRYPISEPSLFAGDEIVRVRNKDVSDKESLYAALNAEKNQTIPVKVRRLHRDGSSYDVNVNLYRGDEKLIRAHILTGQPQIPTGIPRLASYEPNSVGQFSSGKSLVLIGFCDSLKDRNGEPLPVFGVQDLIKDISAKNRVSSRNKWKVPGPLILKDDRTEARRKDEQYYGEVITSKIDHTRWRVGDSVSVSADVLVEEPIETSVNGTVVELTVLTLLKQAEDNEADSFEE